MGYSASHVIYLYCEQSECKNTLEAFGDSFKACLEMAGHVPPDFEGFLKKLGYGF